MLNENDFKKYNFSKDEELITKAMNYLKYADPQHASREDAVSYLEFMHTVAKQASTITPLNFDE